MKILEKKNPKNEIGDGKLAYYDYLIERGKIYKEKHSKLAESKESTVTDGCTFKPKILNKKFATRNPETENEGAKINKWEELFLMAKERPKTKDKKDKELDEIEFSKNPEEYTFQPNAGKKRESRRRSPDAPRGEKL